MKKNIWLWNHYATDMYKNRGGRHYWFAENLVNRGYEVAIFCANTYHNKTEYIDTKDKKYLIDIIDNISFVFVKTTISIGNGINRIKNMSFFYFNLFSVAKEYAKLKRKPDIILASSVHPLTMVAGLQVAKKLGVPCICEVRDLWPEAIFSFNKVKEKSFLGHILTLGEHWIYKNADALIFTKEGDTDHIKEKKWDTKQGGNIDLEKCYYINNGVDLEAFQKTSIEGHGKVVADIALQMEKWQSVSFLDDDDTIKEAMGLEVIGKATDAINYIGEYDIFVAVGNNKTREKIQNDLETSGSGIPILIHPCAIIGSQVELGYGTVIMAGVVINCCTKIGKGCIINTGSTLDHDNVIEDYVHISPGTHLAGTVKVGKGTWLGIGSVVCNNLNIISGCVVGAGAVVVEDINETGNYVGIPVRRI